MTSEQSDKNDNPERSTRSHAIVATTMMPHETCHCFHNIISAAKFHSIISAAKNKANQGSVKQDPSNKTLVLASDWYQRKPKQIGKRSHKHHNKMNIWPTKQYNHRIHEQEQLTSHLLLLWKTNTCDLKTITTYELQYANSVCKGRSL